MYKITLNITENTINLPNTQHEISCSTDDKIILVFDTYSCERYCNIYNILPHWQIFYPNLFSTIQVYHILIYSITEYNTFLII